MQEPGIYADLQNTDAKGRVRLICKGTLEDLARNQIQLIQGLSLPLHDGEEFRTIGVTEFSIEEKIWVAVVDWSLLQPFK